MSRSNYDKPFYVDIGTSIAAVRCASNHDILVRRDHGLCGQRVIKEVEELCDRLNKEAEEWRGKTANPPMGEPTAGTGSLPPLNLPAGADGTEPGEDGRQDHLSNVEAIAILAELARKRTRTLAEVEALMMGANRLFHRHFQRQKNWARRRARLAASEEVQA